MKTNGYKENILYLLDMVILYIIKYHIDVYLVKYMK